MHLISTLLILLIFSRILGAALQRFGQPIVVGELLAGLLLGPAALNWIPATAELHGISQLAIFLIVFAAGLEMDVNEVVRAMRGRGLPIAIVGFLIPLGVGVTISGELGLSAMETAIVALVFSITALPVAIRLLGSMDLLNRPIGHQAVGAIIIIDLVALLGLGIILDLDNATTPETVLITVLGGGLKMALFFSLVVFLDWLVTKRFKSRRIQMALTRLLPKIGGQEALFGISALFVLVFSSMTERMGFHFVIGAFFGGLLVSKDFVGLRTFRNVQGTLTSVTDGFLAPLFFAYIGLQFSREAFQNPVLLFSIIGTGVIAKFLAGYLAGLLVRLPSKEALSLGVTMNARGLMDLIVAEIAFERGFIDAGLFSSLVVLSLISTISGPLIYGRFIKDLPDRPRRRSRRKPAASY